ncbi:MAG: endo-1,4-beta-xylanase [Balneolaceae bacterium]
MRPIQYNKLILFLSVFLLLLASCKDSPTETDEGPLEPSLRNSPNFPMGFAIQERHLADANYVNLLKEDAASITAEYEMKMSPMYNNPSAIDFSKTDAFVEFAEQFDIRVHGHALIWHSATPSWIENFSGTDAEFETLIENYIKEVVGRYKGRIASWDVVNEAFEDGSGHPLRNSVFRQKMGPDYVAKAFQWAREADPDVLLFYNDYGIANDGTKFEAVLELIDDFKSRNIPIDGVGFQMHVSYNWPPISDIQTASGKIVSRDLLLHYSELDIRLNQDGTETEFNAELSQRHVNRINEIVNLYQSLPDENRFGITNWGVKDDDTWLRSFWDNQYEWPLLYDENFQAKPAHQAIIDMFEN